VANIYKNELIDLTTTDNTVIYTTPADSRAIIKSILVSEDAGSTHPLILEENEVLKAQAADANELHVIASILEINRD
jgi:hypothetical protein